MACEKQHRYDLSTIIYLSIKVGQEDIVVQDVLMREGMKMD